ncbi:retinol dehydrogenase 10 [Rhodotorula toruloides]|uniref:Short-chain dehydrogenase/reductase 3 n=1 Tax=Rhodotorula toruloides TaxID=5286 RepID=A0A511KNY6_RHOTO|nr:retinol dehydrogenase 10 [Rhodotorula toruloides]
MTAAALSPLHSAEGFTVDVLLRIQQATFLNPAVACLLPVLAGLRATVTRPFSLSTLRDALQLLPSTFPHIVRTDRPSQLALAVFALAAGLHANSVINRAARNNFARDRKGWDWKSEVVVITGGAGGLGSEVARRLANKGIKVVVLDVAPLAADAPTVISYYKVDLASAEAVKEVADKIRKEVGHPSVLINMAGVVRANAILDMSQREVDLTYDINVKAHYYTIQAFLPHMIEEGHGHVVTIASSTAYHQAATGVAYCSSKAAALSFHEGLTEELRHLYQPSSHARAIRTSVICPAHFKSNMFAGFESGIPEFFAPSLEVGTVAELVEKTVLSGESQHIIEPFYAKCTPLGRALPTWLYGGILACAKDAMGAVRAYRTKER